LTRNTYFGYNMGIVNNKEQMMSYYLVSQSSGLIVSDGPNKTRAYKTLAAAKATRTRLCEKQGWAWADLIVTSRENYQPRMVERTNIMTGARYQEDVNTPRCCSPSSETFWSM
jgi:hypothetical protein